MKRFALGLALLLCAGVGPATAGTIDLASAWNGFAYFSIFGIPNTATYGQTFTADHSLGSQVDSFSFLLHNDNGGTDPTPFSAYLAAWDGSKVSGPILFKSDARYLPTDYNAPSYTEYTIDTGGVQVVDGLQYVIFVSVSEYFTGNIKTRMARVGEVYAGGDFVFDNNGSDFGALSTKSWDHTGARAVTSPSRSTSRTASPSFPSPRASSCSPRASACSGTACAAARPERHLTTTVSAYRTDRRDGGMASQATATGQRFPARLVPSWS